MKTCCESEVVILLDSVLFSPPVTLLLFECLSLSFTSTFSAAVITQFMCHLHKRLFYLGGLCDL